MPPQKCSANFSVQNDDAEFSLHFNSSLSSGDSIISRTWNFGDGTTLGGNLKDPLHSYKLAGTYNACLNIKTTSGCESSFCKQVEVANHCLAILQTSAPTELTVKLNSINSHGTGAADNIIERVWTWGDGTLTKGNLIDPSHTYDKAGVYTLCLRITTSLHCSDSVCAIINIPEPSKVCYARFKTQNAVSIYTLKFLIDSMSLQSKDTLSYFRWDFGDGAQQTVTTSQVEHHYQLPGTYNVCLVLKTLHNCEFKVCGSVIVAPVGKCVAGFTSERIAPKKSG